MNIEVIGLGALNMDHLYRVDRILNDGETVAEEVLSTPGGSAANTIYGLARLSVSTGFIGAVGDDTDGKLLVEDFQKAGVDTSRIKVKRSARSGFVLCLSDRRGKRSLYVNPGANNLLTNDDIDLHYVNQSNMLHVTSFANDRQFQLTRELVAKLDSTVKLSFSPGMLYATRGLEALAPILERTYALFLNHAELRQLTGEEHVVAGVERLRQGCQIIVVTLGKGQTLKRDKGRRAVNTVAYIRDTSGEYVIEPGRQGIATVADTTGAGDAFATGFLYGLLNGKGPEECGRLGNIVAQFCITKLGARTGLPARSELAQRYYELYQQEL